MLKFYKMFDAKIESAGLMPRVCIIVYKLKSKSKRYN